MQLAIPISRSGEPLFRQVYRGLRQAILSGALRARDRLPSTRDLAEQLGISRTVVLLAYDQLLAEGFVSGRGGSGTYVSEELAQNLPSRNTLPGKRQSTDLRLSRFGTAVAQSVESVDSPQRRPAALRYDFVYGRSDLETFPFAVWRRLLLRQARKAPVRQFDYGSALGSLNLREAICAHLRRSRAVVCDPEEVIVVNGSQQALDLVMRVLVEAGDRVAIENPHYNGTREALRAAGARLCPVPVDRHGLDPARLPDDAGLAFVTPSHQFPTGAILTLDRRLALLEWARRRNAVIVEDDYDGEFHYDGRPLESLQGLDPEGRIVYIGTFSRTIFPALRIGYLIAPRSLVPAFTAAKWISDLHSATLEQQTLAEFISNGMYERHLRRLRRRNTARRAALLDAIHKHLGSRVELTGEGAGAQVVLWPRKRVSERAVVAQAARRGVGIYGIAHCFLRQPSRPGFMLGYARLNEKEIREGIRLLAEVL
ncbi:MAG TPA: PLP-dependent aminotransferase family protein [Acidobacteriaceae bacterium]|jgi:GntR family transcriptional regulator/MocR family aminotransferase|nr:PLP-dependent aminotransferase family protein [Acidobacteriaceae bacterium]